MLQRHLHHQQQHKLEHLHQDQPHLVHLSEFWQLYHHPVLQSQQFCQNMKQYYLQSEGIINRRIRVRKSSNSNLQAFHEKFSPTEYTQDRVYHLRFICFNFTQHITGRKFLSSFNVPLCNRSSFHGRTQSRHRIECMRWIR